MNRKTLIASAMLFVAAFMWGMSYGVQSILSQSLGAYTIIFLKAFSGFILIAFCIIARRKFNLKVVLSGALIGVINGMGLIFQQNALTLSTVSKTSFLSGLYILFVPIIQLFTKVRPKKRFWLAVAVACVGMYFLCMNGQFVISIGDIYCLISAVLFAFQIILIAKYTQGADTLVFCGCQQLTTSLISCVFMLILEKPQIGDFKGLLMPILYVMFASGMIAQLLQNRYQKDIDPTITSLIMSLESVFGALSGWILLNQTMSSREIIGAVLIFAAILIAE